MIDIRNPTGPTAASWVGHPIEQGAILRRGGLDRKSLAVADVGIDRAALKRFSVILILLLAAYLTAGPSTGKGESGLVNAVCPILLGLASLWTGYKIVAANPRAIWTPVPWFALATAVYYGFGPLFHLFGDQDTIDYADDFWPVGPYELWRTNLLNTVSLIVLTAALLIADKLLRTGAVVDRAAPTSASDDDSARTAALVFLCIGLPVRYLLVFPAAIGKLDFVLPGFIGGLNNYMYAAIFMTSYLSAKRGGLWKHGFRALFMLEFLSNSLLFMKLNVLLVFIMAALGRYMARRDVRELVYAGTFVLVLYLFVLSPLFSWCRNTVQQEYFYWDRAPIDVRLSVAGEGTVKLLQGEGLHYEEAGKQGWWLRLCYSNAQAAGMHFYDSGASGDSYTYTLYSWIPRFLWPDKPLMDLGLQFNILVQGTENCTGPGIFGEAYWNGGWLMVVLTCGYVGVLFACFSHLAFRILARSEWLFLPCLFMFIFIGLRIDDWFAPTYVTGCLICMAYYFIIRFVLGLGKNRE